MNTDTDLQRQVTSVFADAAPTGYPDELLAHVLSTTSRTRPRPAWLANIKEPPMRFPARVAVGSPTLRLAFILALILSVALMGAAAVGAAASLLPAPRLAPYGLAHNGALVFERNRVIYLADPEGGNAHQIIGGETPAFAPWFSHDGTHIAYGTGPDDAVVLMVSKADGTDGRPLPTVFEWWDFMPDDDAVVGTRIVDGHMVLSTYELSDGKRVEDLPLPGIEPNGWVEPRPTDGSELIFTGHPSSRPSDLGLYAIRPDGTGLRQIGTISTDQSLASDPNPTRISFQGPTLSPLGSTIAYWNWEPNIGAYGSGGHLHMRDLDTGQELPLPFELSDNAVQPHFSPDGTMFLYEQLDTGSERHLAIAPVDGSQPGIAIGLPFDGADRLDHGYSPDGMQAFLSLNGVTQFIDLATDETTQVPDIPTVPSWQRLAP